MEQECGHAFLGGRRAEACDVVLCRLHLVAKVRQKVRAQVGALVEEIVKTAASKASDSDGSDGFRCEQVVVSKGNADEIARVVEAKNGAPAVLPRATHP